MIRVSTVPNAWLGAMNPDVHFIVGGMGANGMPSCSSGRGNGAVIRQHQFRLKTPQERYTSRYLDDEPSSA